MYRYRPSHVTLLNGLHVIDLNKIANKLIYKTCIVVRAKL